MKEMDPKRFEMRTQYISCLLSICLIFIGWVIMYIEPRYTNRFYWYDEPKITENDFKRFKYLNYIKNAILLITWFISASNGNSAISDIELDPDDGGEEVSDIDDDDGDD